MKVSQVPALEVMMMMMNLAQVPGLDQAVVPEAALEVVAIVRAGVARVLTTPMTKVVMSQARTTMMSKRNRQRSSLNRHPTKKPYRHYEK